MKIILTGAAGFIGSNLAKKLIDEGHQIIGVDNFCTGRKENIEELIQNPNFMFIEHDIVIPLKINEDIDWIMNFACPASPPKYLKYPIETLRVNSEGNFNLLELALAKNAKYFFASTSEVYGDPLIHPQVESYWGNVNPNGLRSVYDEGKRYAEAITLAFNRKYNLSTRIIRIFNTYGPNMDSEDGRVVTNFIIQALKNQPITIYGDGSQTRSFQYVDDLIEGIVRLMGIEYFLPVNLGNPEEYKVIELAHLIKEIINSDSKLSFEELPEDDPKKRKPDITLARELLNWSPKIPVQEGLCKTIEYFSSIKKLP